MKGIFDTENSFHPLTTRRNLSGQTVDRASSPIVSKKQHSLARRVRPGSGSPPLNQLRYLLPAAPIRTCYTLETQSAILSRYFARLVNLICTAVSIDAWSLNCIVSLPALYTLYPVIWRENSLVPDYVRDRRTIRQTCWSPLTKDGFSGGKLCIFIYIECCSVFSSRFFCIRYVTCLRRHPGKNLYLSPSMRITRTKCQMEGSVRLQRNRSPNVKSFASSIFFSRSFIHPMRG